MKNKEIVSKRIFDIVASLLGLLLLLPVFAIIAGLIKLQMPGPILFLQQRIGRYGRVFTIVKFRTMVTEHNGNTVSIAGETRITPLGRKLRKFKLDELPELWNVLKGDMSLVGPRPDMPQYAECLEGEKRLILELRPGITGPASLKYYNEEEILSKVLNPQDYNDNILWPDKVRINLDYYYHRSFIGDLGLILRTILRRQQHDKKP